MRRRWMALAFVGLTVGGVGLLGVRSQVPYRLEGAAPGLGAKASILAAIGPNPRIALVVDAQAVQRSPFQKTVLACAGLEGATASWFTPRKLKRIAIVDDAILLSGGMAGRAMWAKAQPGAHPVGAEGVAVKVAGLSSPVIFWRDAVAIVGSLEDAAQIVARLEGPASDAAGFARMAGRDGFGLLHPDVLVAYLQLDESVAARLRPVSLEFDFTDGIMQAAIFRTRTPGDLADVADQLERVITRRAQEKSRFAPDRAMAQMLAKARIARGDDHLRVLLHWPTAFFRARFASCRFGLDGPAPEGFVTASRYEDEGWIVELPRPLVPVLPNAEKLAHAFPGFDKTLSVGVDEGTYVDPDSLQWLTVSHTRKAGVCDRMAKLHAVMAERLNATFETITVASRTWTRQLDREGVRPSLSYTHCRDGASYRLGVAVFPPLSVDILARRVEAILARATFKAR